LWLVVGAPPELANTLEMTPERMAMIYPEGPQAPPPELSSAASAAYDGRGEAPFNREMVGPRWVPPRRLVTGLCIAALIAVAYYRFRTTVPYDPPASAPQDVSAVMAGIEPGKTYTAIVPITTPSGETPTLISA